MNSRQEPESWSQKVSREALAETRSRWLRLGPACWQWRQREVALGHVFKAELIGLVERREV